MAMEQITVKGMRCQHCVKSVIQALEALDGIGKVKVDLASGVAMYETSKPVDKATVRKAIMDVGFEVVNT
ncbi:MAG: heavy-metal-associated domain-containing protein [Desulfocurvibacter africanus]